MGYVYGLVFHRPGAQVGSPNPGLERDSTVFRYPQLGGCPTVGLGPLDESRCLVSSTVEIDSTVV